MINANLFAVKISPRRGFPPQDPSSQLCLSGYNAVPVVHWREGNLLFIQLVPGVPALQENNFHYKKKIKREREKRAIIPQGEAGCAQENIQ